MERKGYKMGASSIATEWNKLRIGKLFHRQRINLLKTLKSTSLKIGNLKS